MTMSRNKVCSQSLCAAALALLAQGLGASGNVGQTIGEAYDLDSDELLYRETHCVNPDKNAREVIYRSNDGRLIARKLLDYSSGLTTPSFVQHNFYSSERVEVELNRGNLTMSVHEIGNPGSKKEKSTKPGDKLPVVIDAGFDEFVRNNWDSLVEGEKKKFLFALVARSSLVELRIRPAACAYETGTDQCFKLELSNWLLRMIAAPIELGYDVETRQLTRYRGLSNIGDENGDGLMVDIQYSYQNLPGLACGISEHTQTENAGVADISSLLYWNSKL